MKATKTALLVALLLAFLVGCSMAGGAVEPAAVELEPVGALPIPATTTPAPTDTVAPTATQTPLPTATATQTASPTPTATDTPVPPTATPTATPLPTETPTPTPTETPEPEPLTTGSWLQIWCGDRLIKRVTPEDGHPMDPRINVVDREGGCSSPLTFTGDLQPDGFVELYNGNGRLFEIWPRTIETTAIDPIFPLTILFHIYNDGYGGGPP